KTESWNYNPSYNQNMGSSDEKNKNEEFMWCANLVETMPMSDMVSDLNSGATTDVSVEAWCDTPAYTQARTNKYGLTKGEKKYADGALPKGHTWALDELETKSVGNDVYLCSDCHTATESTPHTVTLPDAVAGVTLTLGTTSNTYIKDDTVTLTVEKEGTDIVTVTAKNGDTDVALNEVQEAAQDEAAAQATTEKAKTVYTFTMPDGDVTISVAKNAKTYAVNVATLTNGEITASAKEAAEKETVTLTAKPATGYALKAGSVKVTYTDAEGTEQPVKATVDEKDANVYTFAMPAYPVNVSAEFVQVYKITAAKVDNGTVTVEPTTAVAGTDVTVTVTPANESYKYTDGSLVATYKDGETNKEIKEFTAVKDKANTYTFKMPAADVTVSAVFEPVEVKTYSVTATKGGEGTVTVNGQETEKLEGLKSGDTVTLKIDPIDTDTLLTKLAGVTVTSGKVDVSTTKVDENTYTFKMPDGDVNVSVQFTTVEYTIVTEAKPAEGGTITVTVNGKSGLKRAPKDAEMAVTVTPNSGYELVQAIHGMSDITDNVKDGGTYTVGMSECNFEISAEFKKIETTEPTNPGEGDNTGGNTGDNTNNGGEENQVLEAEERTAHGAAEKTTITAMAVFTCTDKNCASAQFVDATVKQTSGVTTAAVNFNGKDYTAKYGEKNGWVEENGKKYWYENGVKQGTEGRGKEIYDPDSDAWYWLDAVQGGAMTVNKDVYQESAAGQWADRPDGTGKWVRYDENGHMIKGWQTTEKGTYYFDPTFGTMAKGVTEIDGVPCAFDQNTGIGLDKQWVTIKGADFWYEKGVRQGLDGRGKEIYDPASDAWYWLDSVDQGKKATSKDVYQESEAGQWADRADGTGKWVRYDAQGHMIKGWSADKRYYFDPIYGTMAKGDAVIDGRTYHFDKNTGVRQ
ncbi:InlB B-repeat-containing protein, partial [Gemmiger sp.]|uniref:InlB B-repeat-containing protein n=1 Tax=Gemmiger sp. TaxID=2049027 RepID=UPI003A927290